MVEMLRGALGREVAQVSQIIKELPATMGTLKDGCRAHAPWALGAKTGVRNLTLAPHTPMNVSVSAHRAFAAVTLPMREVKALGKPRRHHQRHGDGGVRLGPAPLPQPQGPVAAQEPGGRGADFAACRRVTRAATTRRR
jgi:hypothetical protein